MRKVLVLLVGLAVMAGCTAPAEQRAERHAERQGVRIPEPGVEQVFYCQDGYYWGRDERRTLTVMEGGRLRTEMRMDNRERWIEKSAADFGIDVYERADFGKGIWHSTYQIDNLDQVRRLVPGARAKGYIDYTRAGRSVRKGFVVEISQPSTTTHTTLGEIQTIQIRNLSWRWNPEDGAWKDENYPAWDDVLPGKSSLITYVDTATRMIVRYDRVISDGRQITCEWKGTN